MERERPLERFRTVPILPLNYLVRVILTNNVTISRVGRSHILGDWYADGSTAAIHCGVPDASISYIFLPFKADVGYVAHEVSHCLWRLMNFIGAEHENEIMAYHQGYLVRKIWEFIGQTGVPKRRKPIKRRK